MSNSSVDSNAELRGDALRAAARTAAGQNANDLQRRKESRTVGADKIASVVLPFLELSRIALLDQRTALPDQCLHPAEADVRPPKEETYRKCRAARKPRTGRFHDGAERSCRQ